MGTILLIILVLALLGVLPTWNHSRNWGYGPVGVTGLLVVVLIVRLVTGRLEAAPAPARRRLVNQFSIRTTRS